MLSAFAVYNSGKNVNSNPKKRKLPHKTLPKQKRRSSTSNEELNKVIKKNNKEKLNKVIKKTNNEQLNKVIKKNNKLTNNKTKLLKNNRTTIHNKVEVSQHNESDTSNINYSQIQQKTKHTKIEKLKIKKAMKRKEKSANITNVDGDIFTRPLSLLSWILAPISVSEFCNTYWETKPLHIVRNDTDYFRNLLSSKEIDRILRENLLYYTKNVDVVTYENDARQTHNPEGRAVPASVWDYYMNGCSVRIMNPQTYNQKIRSLLSTLQEYFGTMVGVNVYLTPPGSQGFAPHYDDIEAFVIQLEGHKNWKIYAPRNQNEVLPRYSSKNLSRNELDSPIKELTLHAGDLLYFPRGFIHEASTDSNEHSLHITVSVYQNTAYIDLLEKLLPQALKTASELDVNFRKSLPLNYLKHVGTVNADNKTSTRREILNKVKDLICKLVDYTSVDMAADQLGRKFMYEALPPYLISSEKERSCKEDGDRIENGVVRNIASFSPDTMVRLTRYYSQRLVIEDTVARIYYCTENANVYHGEEEQYLELDDALRDTVKALHNNYPQYVSIENLPCNDEIKKIQTISDLWERGLIITKTPLEIEDE